MSARTGSEAGQVPAVRLVGRSERSAVAAMLADAFAGDELSRWLYSDHPARLRWVRADFRLRLAQHAADRRSYVADGRAGAVVWAAPGYWKGHASGQLRAVGAIGRVVRNHVRIAAMQTELDRRHPHLPHLYLALLGVAPGQRHRGVASALVAPTLAEADARQLPAYVEAGSDEAVGFYETVGFQTTGEVRLPGAPVVTLMWREPR